MTDPIAPPAPSGALRDLPATRLFDALDIPVSVFTPDGTYAYINERGCTRLGLRLADLVGRTYLECFPHLRDGTFDEAFRRVVAGPETIVRAEFHDPTADEWSSQTLLHAGGYVIVWWVDVTTAKRAELERTATLARLVDTIEAMSDAFLLLAPDGRVALVNHHYERISRTPRAASVGRPIWEAFPVMPESVGRRAVDRAMATRVAEQFIAFYPSSDTWLEVSLFPTREGGLAVFHRDVTARLREAVEREDLLARAQSAQAEAESASRAKDEFLAMLGHELRNPLAPMVTALELMALHHPDCDARERAVIARQVQHMTRLVDDLLDVARIARGVMTVACVPVDLGDLVARAVEVVAPLFEAGGHRLTVEVPRGLRVAGDAARLTQVVSNLLHNAAKFTPAGGRVAVFGGRAGAEVFVRVRDSGVGVAPEILPRVFDLFVQGVQGIDRAHGGLGLGLALVRRFVELHGGRAEAASDGPGFGSTFTVWLPALSADAPISNPPPEPAPTPRSSGRRVLVVDDNVDAADLIVDMLRRLGYDARAAYTGALALALVEGFSPDVAVLDIGLPLMDGYELARRLRARPELAGVRLVALTGYGQASDRLRASGVGFDAHLVKPITINTLLGSLKGPDDRPSAPPED